MQEEAANQESSRPIAKSIQCFALLRGPEQLWERAGGAPQHRASSARRSGDPASPPPWHGVSGTVRCERGFPCRKCRRNFKRHINNHKCDNAKSNQYFSICLHNEVNKDKNKPQFTQACETLPNSSIVNLFQSEFWSTFYLNTTIDKEGVIRKWMGETERVLRLSNRLMEANAIGEYILSGEIFTSKNDSKRKREIYPGILGAA